MPRLVCNATTPQELREEIVALLLHRARQEEDIAKITSHSVAYRMEHECAARVLGCLAGEVKCMELVNAWPSGLKEEEVKP